MSTLARPALVPTSPEPLLFSRAVPRPRVVRVGLLGLGVVGQGLVALLEERAADLALRHRVAFEVTCVLVRDAAKERRTRPQQAEVTTDREAFLAGDYDVVVEAAGGVEEVAPLVEACLARGLPVVTANKALLADRGEALADLARANGAALRFEASVAAGIPLLGLLERSLQSTTVRRVEGVLNATSNFVLDLVDRTGATLAEALEVARGRGIAEADSRLDLAGHDAAQKLCVLAWALSGRSVGWTGLEIGGIEDVGAVDTVRARRLDGRLRAVAVADLDGGRPRGFVAPAFVPLSHPLARVEGVQNGVHLVGDTIDNLFLLGPGAGAGPTAASLLDDLLEVAASPTKPPPYRTSAGRPPVLGPLEAPSTPWFVAVPLPHDGATSKDAVRAASASGLRFERLQQIEEPRGAVLVGLLAPAPRRLLLGLSTRLARHGLSVRAFRALAA